MTRVSVPFERSTGKPSGPRWTAYRKVLIAGWARQGAVCFYCRHAFSAPQFIEVCHLISPILRPDLAWRPDNLVPGHGRNAGKKGNRRCPFCQLNCNFIAAMAPDAPKDPETGEDLPFTEEFLARQFALLTNSGRNSGRSNTSGSPGKRSNTAGNAVNRLELRRNPSNSRSSDGGPGREW
jgi:hypothetical protein